MSCSATDCRLKHDALQARMSLLEQYVSVLSNRVTTVVSKYDTISTWCDAKFSVNDTRCGDLVVKYDELCKYFEHINDKFMERVEKLDNKNAATQVMVNKLEISIRHLVDSLTSVGTLTARIFHLSAVQTILEAKLAKLVADLEM